MSAPLWTPSAARVSAARITAFRQRAAELAGRELPDYEALHAWSVAEPAAFWDLVWRDCDVLGERGDGPALVDAERMPGARFFPDARLSFAENLLRRHDDAPALIFVGEDGRRRALSFAELRAEVAAIAAALRALGVQPRERVAGYLPNIPETVIAMLAATSLGATWTSCSPDFGARGVLDRFAQVEPSVLLCVDGYRYAGRDHALGERVAEVRAGLPSLRATIEIPFLDPNADTAAEHLDWRELRAAHAGAPLELPRFPFDHPLYVLYSSGTTGTPKCIVHGAGGTLLKHVEEQRLQTDLGPEDRLFYFTTCGWMMWNWLVSGLASEAGLVLFDGSPFHPGPEVLWDLADAEGITVFGTSAKYLDALAKAGAEPRRSHDLTALDTILSTGSPLSPEGFRWVYDAIKGDVCLASISGGTDIVGCFVGGHPAGPVWAGEAQVRMLGMDVAAFDEAGRPVVGRRGELVCRKPFPSLPLGFWNDPDGARYRAAYFERYPGCWHHGDFVELTEHGGMIIHGRSDAVLNPGGVRIGTAEIYRPVEQFDEVVEALAIGQEHGDDERVVLFVRLREGVSLDDDLRARLRAAVRQQASPRHVPAVIAQVADIPRTRSGKIVELAVREVVHGRPVTNTEALANSEALALFRDHPDLA